MLPPPRKPADGLAALHMEFAAEKAGAMARVTEKLEVRLATCARLAAAYAEAPDAELAAEYERVRQDAKLHHWYLIVQREAIGLYDHTLIARLYPIPPRLA
jgi:hypothetical protein